MTKEKREALGEDISYLLHKAVEVNDEKWTTAVMYNVDIETFDRIRTAKHALDNPTKKL